MDLTVASPPPLVSIGIAVFIAAVWIGPIGLFVLRKHLKNASGALLVVKGVLTVLTALTAPVAGMMVLMIVLGTTETFSLLWSLLRDSW